MKKRILTFILTGAMIVSFAGCTNTTETKETPAEQTVTQEELDAEAEAARLEEERIAAEKAEEERLEQERLEAEAAEAERVAGLREEIADIIENEVPALAEEMTANYNEEGLLALTSLVDSYDETALDVDEFMESYETIVADKEAYDAAWEEFPYLVTALDETTRYASQSVNVRSLPSEEGEVLGSFNTNDEITVIGESGDWYQILYNEDMAYVFKSLTSENKVEVAATTGGNQSGVGFWSESDPMNTWIDRGTYFIYFGSAFEDGSAWSSTIAERGVPFYTGGQAANTHGIHPAFSIAGDLYGFAATFFGP